MYTFNLNNLNSFDWYLIGLWMYDRAPGNLWYVCEKAFGKSFTGYPVKEIEAIYTEFGNAIFTHLKASQDDVQAWVDAKIVEADELSAPDVQLSPVFKKFIDTLGN